MESLTFQPNKKGVISGCTIPVIVVLGFFAYAMFPDGYKFFYKGGTGFRVCTGDGDRFWLRCGIGLYHEISWIPHDD